ncbi:MAG: oligoendopeptidase F [Verrucomicrobia bacterium]|nr:oligoendopeptidase F [Verrucomicrobiota bacterium]
MKTRTEISLDDKWNVEALYPSIDSWEKDFNQSKWQNLGTFRGRLAENPAVMAEFLKDYFQIEQGLSKLFTYAHLRHDEDVAEETPRQAFMRALKQLHLFREEMAWVEPEILQMPQEKISMFLAAKELAPYRVHLEKILRLKPHTLSPAEEELVASAGMALGASQRAFGAFNNADIKFPAALDAQGNKHDVTHGTYLSLIRNPDRTLRKNAFESLSRTFASYENTLCELIHGQIQSHLFNAKAHKFSSCLEAALFPFNIDPAVYKNLIKTVRDNLTAVHRYMEVRKTAMGLSELHMYDLHVPIVQDVDFSVDYTEAEKYVIAGVAPLGKEYQQRLESGLKRDRWVDRFENARKRSGAYSSGCYGSMPYILMNYHGKFHDMMTLSHEAGHSMHSLLSWSTQPYHYADYPIFVAEVASTFHEEMLLRHLMSEVKDPKMKAFLINQQIEDMRNTFFRQTMFAEFELKVHSLVEQGVALTPGLLKQEYHKLNQDYFGPHVVIDSEIDIEWARIPHFYYNFYVYQYATGIAAAHALVDIVEKEGPKNYLAFLSSGGSAFPLDLLRKAGVDMTKSSAITTLIGKFRELAENLHRSLQK